MRLYITSRSGTDTCYSANIDCVIYIYWKQPDINLVFYEVASYYYSKFIYYYNNGAMQLDCVEKDNI